MNKALPCHSERLVPPSALRSSTPRLISEVLRLEESKVEGLVPSKAEGSEESEFNLLT